MSQFDVPTITAFSGLAVVALALALQAHRWSAAMFIVGMLGLLCTMAGLTWLAKVRTAAGSHVPTVSLVAPEPQPAIAPVGGSLPDDSAKWRKEAEAAKTVVADLKASLDKALTEVQRARDVRQVEEQRRAHAEMLAGRAEERAQKYEKQSRELEERIARIASPAPQSPPEKPSKQQADRKPDTVTTAPPVAGLAHLRSLLGKEVKTPFYAVEPLPDREIVTGLSGTWYQITLQAGEDALSFPDRQFRAPDAAKQVAESAGHVVGDIIAPLADGGRQHRLFVKGSADDRPISGATERPDVDTLAVLRRRADGSYESDARTVPISRRVRNEQLPLLRADWLRRQLAPALPRRTREMTAILDNPPGPEHDRTAVLLLFVAWGDKDQVPAPRS